MEVMSENIYSGRWRVGEELGVDMMEKKRMKRRIEMKNNGDETLQ